MGPTLGLRITMMIVITENIKTGTVTTLLIKRTVVTVPIFIFSVITIIMVILNSIVGPIKIRYFNFG